jgi:hypothetical protein
MREVTKQWIAYTNARKQATDEAQTKERETRLVSISAVPQSERIVLPGFVPKPKAPQANVNYSVPRERLRKLAAGFGNINMTYRDVGVESFEYAYSELVGEE